MRPVRALGIYIAVVFLGGALLAPWLYWLAQAGAHEFPSLVNAPLFSKIVHSPFHRFVNRSLLGLALIGLWPLLKSLGTTSFHDIGLVNPSGQGKWLGAGFLVGFVSLGLVAAAAVAGGARHLSQDFTRLQLGERLLSAALTAVVVAVLEEVLFRGALFGSLRKVFHWIFALVVSSLIYAGAHFFGSAPTTAPVTWYAGLALLPRMCGGLADWQAVIPGFFNLTLAGALLALAYQRTGNLYCSIGLHCGWIFWLKLYGFVSFEVPGASTWWWGTGKMVNGWVALLVLAATFLIFEKLSAPRRPEWRL